MKRAILVSLSLVAVTAVHGLAAQPAAESKADPREKSSAKAAADAPESLIPERELTFVCLTAGILEDSDSIVRFQSLCERVVAATSTD